MSCFGNCDLAYLFNSFVVLKPCCFLCCCVGGFPYAKSDEVSVGSSGVLANCSETQSGFEYPPSKVGSPFRKQANICSLPYLSCICLEMKELQNCVFFLPKTPSEHPNPTTKIDSKMGGEFTYQPKMGSQNGVDHNSHLRTPGF